MKENYSIGSYYDDGKIKGIVASMRYNKPHIIISLYEYEDNQTWYDTMIIDKKARESGLGWHVPSKNELDEIWKENRDTTKILNSAIIENGGMHIQSRGVYWTSTQCLYHDEEDFMSSDVNNAYAMFSSTGCFCDCGLAAEHSVRLVATVEEDNKIISHSEYGIF